jgi:hypothetical protein
MKKKLKYFLDHPQIKRNPSPGNGESPGFLSKMVSNITATGNKPGSLADKSNFGGNKPAEAPKAEASKPVENKKPSIAEQINFGGKFRD